MLPVARHIAEIRGLLNQAIRRLERLEGALLAERHARVDDLALLVDLVSSGWKGVDARLERLERDQADISLNRVRGGEPEPTSFRQSARRTRRRGLIARKLVGAAGSSEPEPASAPRATRVRGSAQGQSELLRDRQSQARAVNVPRHECVEDPGSLLQGTPDRCRRRRPRPHRSQSEQKLDTTAVRRPPECVREQIGDHLQHSVTVRHDDRRASASASR